MNLGVEVFSRKIYSYLSIKVVKKEIVYKKFQEVGRICNICVCVCVRAAFSPLPTVLDCTF